MKKKRILEQERLQLECWASHLPAEILWKMTESLVSFFIDKVEVSKIYAQLRRCLN